MCQCPQRASTYFFKGDAYYYNNEDRSVSMPSTGFYLFLPSKMCKYDGVLKSVNALNGLLLISSIKIRLAKVISSKACQCPQRASTYFITERYFHITYKEIVSMPSTGFYLFLLCKLWRWVYGNMCQCPQRASTYFFKADKSQSIKNCWCVNALNGLLLISSKQNRKPETRRTWKCQCPQRASTYFFNITQRTSIYRQVCVNALNGLLLISS